MVGEWDILWHCVKSSFAHHTMFVDLSYRSYIYIYSYMSYLYHIMDQLLTFVKKSWMCWCGLITWYVANSVFHWLLLEIQPQFGQQPAHGYISTACKENCSDVWKDSKIRSPNQKQTSAMRVVKPWGILDFNNSP